MSDTAPVRRALRLADMMQLFRTDDGAYTVDELARRYGVSERTVQRDLADLQDEPIRLPLVLRRVWSRMRCRKL